MSERYDILKEGVQPRPEFTLSFRILGSKLDPPPIPYLRFEAHVRVTSRDGRSEPAKALRTPAPRLKIRDSAPYKAFGPTILVNFTRMYLEPFRIINEARLGT